MPRLTDEEIAQRKDGLGASEVAIILGQDKYTSPRDLYNLKVKGVEKERSPELDEKAEWGHAMEPVIAEMYCKRMGLTYGVDVLPWVGGPSRGAGTVIFATPDYLAIKDGNPSLLEIKNRSAYSVGLWGESGTSDVDPKVYTQVQMQMFCTGIREATVAVCFGGNELRWYPIQYDPAFVDEAVAQVTEWWEQWVVNDSPDEETPRVAMAPRTRVVDDSPATEAIVREYLRAKRDMENDKKKLDEWTRSAKELLDGGVSLYGTKWGSMHLQRVDGKETTDWRNVAVDLADATECDPTLMDELVGKHTKRGAGYDRFTVKPSVELKREIDNELRIGTSGMIPPTPITPSGIAYAEPVRWYYPTSALLSTSTTTAPEENDRMRGTYTVKEGWTPK